MIRATYRGHRLNGTIPAKPVKAGAITMVDSQTFDLQDAELAALLDADPDALFDVEPIDLERDRITTLVNGGAPDYSVRGRARKATPDKPTKAQLGVIAELERRGVSVDPRLGGTALELVEVETEDGARGHVARAPGSKDLPPKHRLVSAK